MNRHELRDELERLGIPSGSYTIDGTGNETYCLVEEGDRFVVFYSERGNRNKERVHPSESEACSDLLTRLGRDGTVQSERRGG